MEARAQEPLEIESWGEEATEVIELEEQMPRHKSGVTCEPSNKYPRGAITYKNFRGRQHPDFKSHKNTADMFSGVQIVLAKKDITESICNGFHYG